MPSKSVEREICDVKFNPQRRPSGRMAQALVGNWIVGPPKGHISLLCQTRHAGKRQTQRGPEIPALLWIGKVTDRRTSHLLKLLHAFVRHSRDMCVAGHQRVSAPRRLPSLLRSCCLSFLTKPQLKEDTQAWIHPSDDCLLHAL